jgi:hypothetical protein
VPVDSCWAWRRIAGDNRLTDNSVIIRWQTSAGAVTVVELVEEKEVDFERGTKEGEFGQVQQVWNQWTQLKLIQIVNEWRVLRMRKEWQFDWLWGRKVWECSKLNNWLVGVESEEGLELEQIDSNGGVASHKRVVGSKEGVKVESE